MKGPEDCWNFKGGKDKYGYGYFWIDVNNVRAHRFAYESYYKCKIPYRKYVLHKCDNPSCCNPRHLYLGTQSDNMQDKIRRGRSKIRETACSLAKLYAREIRAIRKLKILIPGYTKRYKFSQNL